SVSRQTGSHVRLSRTAGGERVHLTVPRHGSLRVGTLNAILRQAATQLELDKEALAERLFGTG
ncbi:MAG: type II toxin-antitoxin system HicA family toxin, partial [Xanthomonadales bacterium]|nr:type II toxin-antitoxin system HicA family toxin [Xanthomonadales bacterium]